ncbi:MAG: DUF2812 domain-containing protein [Lachnospiraceae bacterium]|nr:DUF2812 domain-containing protein [Lachnospiraceae bacterium]
MKKQVRWFDITQYQKEEEYLRSMHKKGYKFVKVTGIGMYHFEACKPEDVVYQLDYNQDGIEHKQEYIQMFEDCGWRYLQDYAGYSYFCKPVSEMKGEESIFCDVDSRMEMLRRVFRGRVLPLICLFLCCVIPQILFRLDAARRGHGLERFSFGIVFAVFVVYLLVFIRFAFGFAKLKKQWGR